MRFLCDEMLGKLARDLRLLGYDAAYARGLADEEVLAWARRDDRLLVTRDRDLAREAGDEGLLVTSLDPAAQLEDVVTALDLAPTEEAFLSRCTRCGGGLVEEAASADHDLPEGVRGWAEVVWRCGACGWLYWEGTHVDDIRRRLGRFVTPARDS